MQILGYNVYYTGSIYTGSHDVAGSHASLVASALKAIYTWPVSLASGKVTLSSEAVLGVGHLNVTAPTPQGQVSSHSTSFLDPAIFPIEFTWHAANLTSSTGVAVWLPLGSYDQSARIVHGLGQNHYAIAPFEFITYDMQNAILDLAIVGETNTTNSYTKYRSGNDITTTLALSYKVTTHLMLGPTAYYYKQISDDKQDGVNVPGGNRGQALGLGAQIVYGFGPGLGVLLKFFHETLVRNRVGGNALWFEFSVPLRL
ncbi:SphA family protein [Paraburkholderia caribensis]|uniref:SphA family protein n=1 Tax=Paraburkholderia caribensis TaxID=75105 RepID=UPI0034D24017